MPFRLVAAFDLVLVAFIYVGSVNRPAAKAEQRPSRDVLGTVSSDAAINAVSDGVVVGAPDVDDPSRAPSTPGHQVRRTFAYFGGWFGACWCTSRPCVQELRRCVRPRLGLTLVGFAGLSPHSSNSPGPSVSPSTRVHPNGAKWKAQRPVSS